MLRFVWRNFGARRMYLASQLAASYTLWKLTRDRVRPQKGNAKILIIPPDPKLITASLGDQAMIHATLDYWRQKRPNHEIFFATVEDSAKHIIKGLGAKHLPLMGHNFSIADWTKAMSTHRFEVAILLGADGMDGSYDPAFSGRQLMALDLAARHGAQAFITGFSISRQFHSKVRQVFSSIDEGIRIGIRDPASKQRFEQASSRTGHQVADIAFLLQPRQTPRLTPLLEKMADAQANGLSNVVINLHPLLLGLREERNLQQLIEACSVLLTHIASEHAIHFIPLCHDRRGKASDIHVIKPLYESISKNTSIQIHTPIENLQADEIKYLVGQVDAVICGRMHLMIASLGAKTPVFGIDYKDKMGGLMELLGLHTTDLSSASAILQNPIQEASKMGYFLKGLGLRKNQIVKQHSYIKGLAQQNFETPDNLQRSYSTAETT